MDVCGCILGFIIRRATVEEATLAVAVQGLKYAVENGTEMN